jgi:hypothetical protein
MLPSSVSYNYFTQGVVWSPVPAIECRALHTHLLVRIPWCGIMVVVLTWCPKSSKAITGMGMTMMGAGIASEDSSWGENHPKFKLFRILC